MRRSAKKIVDFDFGCKIETGCINYYNDLTYAIATKDNFVKLYHSARNEIISSFEIKTQGSISKLFFQENSVNLIICTTRGQIFLYDINKEILNGGYKGHSSGILCGNIFPDEENYFVTGGIDSNVKLWDLRKKDDALTYKDHTSEVTDVCISPNGKWISSVSNDCSMKIWDIRLFNFKTQKENYPINCIKYNPFEIEFVFAGNNKFASCFNADAENINFSIKYNTSKELYPINKIDFNSDGKILFTIANNQIKLWDNSNGNLIENIEGNWKNIYDSYFNEKNNCLNLITSQKNKFNIFSFNLNENNKNSFNNSNNQNIFNSNENSNNFIEKNNPNKIDNNFNSLNSNANINLNKEKMKIENEQNNDVDEFIIENILKKHESFTKLISQKIDYLNPIIENWNEGNINNVIKIVKNLNERLVISDLLNYIIETKKLTYMSPNFASIFVKKCQILIEGEYLYPAKIAIKFLSSAYNQFSKEFIQIKSTNLLTKVDLQREERIKNYEILLEEFITISKNKRMTKLLEKLKNDNIENQLQNLLNDISFLETKYK